MRLGNHCEKIGSGATPRGGKESYLAAGPYSLIRSQNVYNDGFTSAGLAYISEGQAAALANVEVHAGDVLVNITGDSVARACQVDAQVLPARVNQHVAIVRPKKQTLDPTFLRYWFVTNETQNHLLALASAGATRPALTKAMLENLIVPAPDIDEQRAIAAILSILDDKIELNRRMNETLEASARALFRDWFVDFGPTRAKAEVRPAYLAPALWSLFPDRFDGDGTPHGWERESLIDQAHWVNGAAYKDMHFVDQRDGLPVVKIAELKAGVTAQTKFTNTDLGARYRIDDGELLFSWSGNPDTSIDAFVWTGGAAWLNQHIFAVRENGKRAKAELFVLLKWLMPEFAEIARNKQTTGLGHVTKDDMRRLQVVVPSRAVREAFSKRVIPIFDQLLSNITESGTLAATRDALLPKLMSGELRVRDAEALAA